MHEREKENDLQLVSTKLKQRLTLSVCKKHALTVPRGIRVIRRIALEKNVKDFEGMRCRFEMHVIFAQWLRLLVGRLLERRHFSLVPMQ